MQRICVFLGSSTGARKEYAAAARSLAHAMLERNIGLVYGGASIGLMGVIADEMLAGGGDVVGIIPQPLVEREFAHRGLSDLRITRSMHERKALMAELSEGFIALPGGFGTLEEFAEVLTWSQLDIQRKPCGLLDVGGYYAPLLDFFDVALDERFVRATDRGLVLSSEDPHELLDALEAWTPGDVAETAGSPIPSSFVQLPERTESLQP